MPPNTFCRRSSHFQTLPTLAPIHPPGPKCRLGEGKAGGGQGRRPTPTLPPPPPPPPPPWLLLAPGAPLAYLFSLLPPPPLCGAVVPSFLMGKQTGGWGWVNCSRHSTRPGVGGAGGGHREEGCSLEVFRVTAVCGETAVCPPGTLRTPRRRCCQPPYSVWPGSGHLQTRPPGGKGVQGGLHQQSPQPWD